MDDHDLLRPVEHVEEHHHAEGAKRILESSRVVFDWISFICDKNFLSGFGVLDFHDFIFQTSKPEHAVKLNLEFPFFYSKRYWHAAGNGDSAVQEKVHLRPGWQVRTILRHQLVLRSNFISNLSANL